ncbi:MAG: tryptophan synthase alpha chain [Candidatus Saganbacteria bacterium]|uniref:Tryptophan synthase alpha chain n=1 Tax=Candidatus Saganbacteria bacterium TaxID=2575572 RepID=A0A833NWL7_UNCSA|nr:MAG: tryptophan synthase alpha chain [Candidatus Saganbacteria bacterium]
MSRISEVFGKRKALIPFITVGDPSISQTEKLVYDLEKAGADIIELGVPFSDPIADGPVIQAAHNRALKNNVSLQDAFLLANKVSRKIKIPLVFMLSQNLIENYGSSKFFSDCAKYGVGGVIIPDSIPDEMEEKNDSIDRILLVSPTTNEERIKMIAQKSSGFIYLISSAGITGKRSKISADVSKMAAAIKKYTNKPIAVGFGISNPAQAKEAAKHADGVIVGSALVEIIAKKQFKKAADFIKSLRRAIDAG